MENKLILSGGIMGAKEMKQLKIETGASFSECKQALNETDSFADAIVFVKSLIAKREAAELQAEKDREDKQKASRLEKENLRQQWSKFCSEFQHMSSQEIQEIFESCNNDWAETRLLAKSENDKRSIVHAERAVLIWKGAQARHNQYDSLGKTNRPSERLSRVDPGRKYGIQHRNRRTKLCSCCCAVPRNVRRARTYRPVNAVRDPPNA